MNTLEERLQAREAFRDALLEAGAVSAGFAEAAPVDADVMEQLKRWTSEGRHAGMDYLVRHIALKGNPETVLPGARTVISVAFSYFPEKWRDSDLPYIAAYAYGDDYHDVVRQRLTPVIERFRAEYGGDWRICADSAPLAERYWAMKTGIGRSGRNGCVIIDGAGSFVFLAEILTTVAFPPDVESNRKCIGCGKCVRECPVGAIREDGTIDSRRCLSYLTIEHRGEWDATGEEVMKTHNGRNTLYGCDRCLRVCPHNEDARPSAIDEFRLRQSYSGLTAGYCLRMTQEEFSRLFRRSAIKRAKLSGLLRNASNLEN